MATKVITALTLALAGNLNGTVVVPLDDVNGNTRRGTLAMLRTNMFAGGTGYTAADPLVVGAIAASGASSFGGGTNGVRTGSNASFTSFAALSFNNDLSDAGNIGFFGGGSDAYLYMQGVSGVRLRTAGVIVVAADGDTTAGNTRLLVYCVDTGALSRVKTGANGSGPGGVGRALYV